MAEPVWFHIDVNSAFLSWTAAYRTLVEGRTPDLRDIPSVIANDKNLRTSIVLAKSTPAKKYGVKTGEPLGMARDKCPNLVVAEPDYALYDGKFVRTLSLPPDHDYTSEEIARAISDYVQLFDRLMKAYLAGKYTPPEIEALYCAQQQRAAILI